MRKTVTTVATVLTLAGCTQAAAPSQSPSKEQPAAASSAAPSRSGPSPTAAKLASALRAAGLRLGHVTVYTASTDPNHLLGRQGGYTSKVEWRGGGGIEVYPSVQGAEKRLAYLKTFTGTMIGDGYDYRAGTAILRLPNALTPAQARMWRTAFERAAR